MTEWAQSFITILVLLAVVQTDIFGNCGCIVACWQLLDLSWMHIKHIKGLQVTEIRSIKYSEFHNYFGAVRSGPDLSATNPQWLRLRFQL